MKRGLFLVGVGAVAAAGCSHHGGSSFLPKGGGALPGSSALAAAFSAGPLPSNPIVGEVRRFDGDVAPAGWLICDGRAIAVRDNPELARIIGRSTGGDGLTSVNLPKAREFRIVIAAGGAVPRTPAELRAIFDRRAAPPALSEAKSA